MEHIAMSAMVPVTDINYSGGHYPQQSPDYPDYIPLTATVLVALVAYIIFRALTALRPGVSDNARKRTSWMIWYCACGIVLIVALFLFLNSQFFTDTPLPPPIQLPT